MSMIGTDIQLQPTFIEDVLPTQMSSHINALPNIQVMTHPYKDNW